MRVILLRHTRTLGAEDRCIGRTDLRLADTFEAEAAAILMALPPVRRIVTSPLSRCTRLAELIARERRLPVAVEPRLAEMSFGRWDGLPWDEVPRAEVDAWAADLHNARPHGGESVAELAARVAAALVNLGDGDLVVTHNGVIRAALAAAGREGAWEARVPFGSFVEIAAVGGGQTAPSTTTAG